MMALQALMPMMLGGLWSGAIAEHFSKAFMTSSVMSVEAANSSPIWHVMYMYKDGDALAKEVVDHVFGQLK